MSGMFLLGHSVVGAQLLHYLYAVPNKKVNP